MEQKKLYARMQSPIMTPAQLEDWQKQNNNQFIHGERILVDYDGDLYEKVAIKTNGKIQLKNLNYESANIQEAEEWDYVITKAEDFTTETLATMSGRVLVKGVTVPNTYPDFPRREVELPPSISLIKFIDSKMYADITASANGATEILGFVGFYASLLGGGSFTELRNFKKVESCTGYPQLYNCSNIRNSTIHGASNCKFIDNVHCLADRGDGYYDAFDSCIVLSNITFDQLYSDDSKFEIDFLNCKHLSNIHALNSNVIINYQGCLFVDGDTCDGYYIEEDNGKVQIVSTDGSKSLISVYDKMEIDGMLGDIGSILTTLHEGGIE